MKINHLKINIMKLKNYIFITFLLIGNLSYSQVFNKLYSEEDLHNEQTSSSYSSVIVDDNSDIITVHRIVEFESGIATGSHSGLVVKTDPQGSVLWSKRIGVPKIDEITNAIVQTDDGGYLVVGSIGKQGQLYRNWAIKLDTNGNIVWQRVYDNSNFSSESLLIERTIETSETYLVVGSNGVESRVTAMKINGNGEIIQFSKRYIESMPNLGGSVDITPTSMVYDSRANGYVITGLISQIGEIVLSDIFTLGITLEGDIYSNFKIYDVQFSRTETEPHIVENIENEGFMIAFGTNSPFDVLGSRIAVMPLSADLITNIAVYYTSALSNNDRNQKANSIYAEPDGFYSIGATLFDENNLEVTEYRASFLKISGDFEP